LSINIIHLITIAEKITCPVLHSDIVRNTCYQKKSLLFSISFQQNVESLILYLVWIIINHFTHTLVFFKLNTLQLY